ncbi:MAG: hypothetical protein GX034_06830 [Clostridiaceae bacterium]|jgi:hypothetical protein|nr:hypothetical protein [Clostridiaceae bacterium]
MSVKAGISQIDISPRKGTELGGYPYFARHNTGIHDPLIAAGLYLETESKRVLFLATDLFYLTKRQATEFRQAIANEVDLHPQEILISCSHTHSAPWVNPMFVSMTEDGSYEPDVDETYVEFVKEQLIKLAKNTLAEPFEAELGFGMAFCGKEEGVGGNRRDPQEGICDPSLPLLAVRNLEGELLALHTKYAVHPTILHGENTLVSADYPGAIRRIFNESYPEATFMFSLGAAGDQSPRYFRSSQTFEEVDRFGRSIGKAILNAMDKIKYSRDVSLDLASKEMELIMKDYSEPDAIQQKLDNLRSKEQSLIEAGASYTEQQTANLWVLGAECELKNAKLHAQGELIPKFEESSPVEATVLKLNKRAYVFLQGEIFMDFAKQIEDLSPFEETVVITLANGELPGYLVTGEALEIGGYEPGNSLLDPKSGEIVISTVKSLLNDAYKK